MSGQHTPGKWEAHRYVGRQDSWFIRGPDGQPVCGSGSGPIAEANARLIAAAPDLLEALEDAVEIMDDQLCGDFPETMRHLKSVIAKARGAA